MRNFTKIFKIYTECKFILKQVCHIWWQILHILRDTLHRETGSTLILFPVPESVPRPHLSHTCQQRMSRHRSGVNQISAGEKHLNSGTETCVGTVDLDVTCGQNNFEMRIQICELRLNILWRARRWWCKAGEMRENMKYLINMCSHAKKFIEQFIRNQQRIIQFFIPAISQLRCWDTIIPDQSNPRSTIWWSSTESYWDLIATSSRVTWAVLRWLRLETGWQTTPAPYYQYCIISSSS